MTLTFSKDFGDKCHNYFGEHKNFGAWSQYLTKMAARQDNSIFLKIKGNCLFGNDGLD